MEEDKLNILLEHADDVPHWYFCRLLAVMLQADTSCRVGKGDIVVPMN